MITETYPDLKSLWYNVTLRMMLEPDLWDALKAPRIFSFTNVLTAQTHQLDGDLSQVGFTKARWTRFLNRYVDHTTLSSWLQKAKEAEGLTSLLWKTKTKEGDHTGGECMVGMSFRPSNNTLTVYSREVEFPTRGLLDAAFINRIGFYLDRGDLKVVWMIGGLQLSMLHSIPFLVKEGKLDQMLALDTKTGSYLRYMTNHLTNGHEVKYGPAKRMKKRWDSINAGTLELVPISGLSLGGR